MPALPTDWRHRLVPIVSAQALGLACGIVAVRLNSYLIPPADYGLYGVFVSLVPVGYGVVFAGLVKFVSRQWVEPAQREGMLPAVAAAALRKLPWLLLAVLLLTWIAHPAKPAGFATALFAAAAFASVSQVVQTALQAARENWRDFAAGVVSATSRAFLPVLCFVLAGGGAGTLFTGFCLHAVLTAAACLWVIRRHLTRAPAGPPAITAVYEGPLFVSLAVAGWVVGGANRWITSYFFGAETAGHFTLAANLGTIPPSMLGTIALLYFQPVWFATPAGTPAARADLARRVDRVAACYTLLGLGVAALLRAVMPWLIGPLISPHYAASTDYLLGAGCFTTAVTTGFFFHALLLAGRCEKACGPADLSGAAILVAGAITGAALGRDWFLAWLYLSPLVPWLVNRTLARRHLLTAA